MVRRTATVLGQEVHVWYVPTELVANPDTLATCEQILSPDERLRGERYRLVRDRHLNLIGCSLVRLTLSYYVDVTPQCWRFVRNSHGRPEIAAPMTAPPLRFSLSHTDGLVACAVVASTDIGIDVQDTSIRHNVLDLAKDSLSSDELGAFNLLAVEARRDRFFDYWTLKESYVKAAGRGFAIPLHRCSFDLAVDGKLRVCFDPQIPDDPNAWQFSLSSPTGRHRMALAVRRGDRADFRIRAREATLPGTQASIYPKGCHGRSA